MSAFPKNSAPVNASVEGDQRAELPLPRTPRTSVPSETTEMLDTLGGVNLRRKRRYITLSRAQIYGEGF